MKFQLCGMTALIAVVASAIPAGAQEKVAMDLNLNGSLRRIVIELDSGLAPKTVENFRQQVSTGYYKGLAVHRAIPDYLVQMGDPYTKDDSEKHLWGTGGPDFTVPAELGGAMDRGAVAMARLPDSQNPSKASNGGQFFIALDRLSNLDGDYSVFGQVISGIEHLDTIAGLTTDTNDVPIRRVEIHAASGFSGDATPASSSADNAILSGVRGAGSAMVGAVPDRMPLISKREPEPGNIANAPMEDIRIGGSGEAVVGAEDSRKPPEFDLLEDEIASTTISPASPDDPVDEIDMEIPDYDAGLEEEEKKGLGLPSLSMPSLPFGGGNKEPKKDKSRPEKVTANDAAAEEEGDGKFLFIPVPQIGPKEDKSEKGGLTRFVERVW